MKTLLLSSLLLVNSTTVLAMQHDGRAKPDIDKLITTLQLDDTQAAELKELMQHHRQQMDSLRDNNRSNHEQMRVIHNAHREELQKLLNDEQFYKFDIYMRQFHPHPHRNQ